MSRYKLLVTDLDGTLLDSRSEITDGVKEAVKILTGAGMRFVIASGRCYKSINRFERELGLDVPGGMGIGFNGGMIYETDTLRVLYEKRLPNAQAMEIIAELKKTGEEILVYLGDTLISERETEKALAYKNLSRLPLMLMPLDTITEDVSKILVKAQPEAIIRLESHMTPLIAGRLNMFRSAPTLLELCNIGVDKGAGLELLCGMLGIDKSQSIAVGDSANDVPMLKSAGLGIAVANAEENVKREAAAVCGLSNDQDAIAAIINEYF